MPTPKTKKETLAELHEILGDKYFDFKLILTKEFNTPELKAVLKIIKDINKKVRIMYHRAAVSLIKKALIEEEDKQAGGKRTKRRFL